MAADDPADVEDDRTGQAEMGEQQRAAPRRQRLLAFDDAHGHVRQRDAAQLGDPGHR